MTKRKLQRFLSVVFKVTPRHDYISRLTYFRFYFAGILPQPDERSPNELSRVLMMV